MLSGVVFGLTTEGWTWAAIVTPPRPRPRPPEVPEEPLPAEALISTRSRISLTSRTIRGLTVAAATVSGRPPPRLPPTAIPERNVTSRALPLTLPAVESSAKIGRPIVSHITVTSGSASATGAKRVRRRRPTRGAGNRRGRSM
ncbi:MAG: hypothetical protein QOD43_1391 [Gaiellaceae bacterium]|nr:hypothetical protein [Gaiellaceae bacterium]